MILTLLLALAYAPLVGHLAVQVSAYFYLAVALRLAALRWKQLMPNRWLLLPLTLGGGLNVFGAYHTIAGQYAGTALLATMLALKLLETHKVRDIRFVTILFGFLLISQFLFDQSPILTLYLAALLIANVALMADLYERAPNNPIRQSLLLASRMVLQALPLALVLFVFFPRLSEPLWRVDSGDERAISGVRALLEPGAVSELVLDGELAFRVRFDGKSPSVEDLYWRGPVLWRTDGRRWLPREWGRADVDAPVLEETGRVVDYTLILQPHLQRWLFALDLPNAAPQGAELTLDFQVRAQERIEEVAVFRMRSSLSYKTGPLTSELRAAALELPSNVSERMRRLVQRWQDEADDPKEVLQRALSWFSEEPFYYTLMPPRLGENPADEFLFETKRGFCEHYASSFALLMRIAGIPARILVGYMGGEYNPLGGYLMVRQSDAHAWVEVWLEGEGWVRVDPTAAVPPDRVDRQAFLQGFAGQSPASYRLDDPGFLRQWVHGLGLFADAIDEGWRLWVLEYSRARQLEFMRSVGLAGLREYGLLAAMLVASGVAVGFLGLVLNRAESKADTTVKIYARFCRRLARVGLERRPWEGPADYCARVAKVRPDLAGSVREFTELYLVVRYADRKSTEHLRSLRRYIRRLRL